jgi:hypothetical protein
LKKIGYISDTPSTEEMRNQTRTTLTLELTDIEGINPHDANAVDTFAAAHKDIKNVVVSNANLAIQFARAKYGVAVFKTVNTAPEGKSEKLSTTGVRMYTPQGGVFQNYTE